ncbi:saccharopine dehydrogenase NADP-binding domain-containing protein [Simiduia curdlanivorans]|uniref:Saccharopine dehydrogenase family protein n=1 Tax=Simiduia curdlanivorans TaxID=1492769 RepID=A0ABV8V717_9GAMM|nr:saccharopine dehydrogenase NADP-binding domain-containing protein [Simiduia curdlanivorans]MDN3640744.1 saccharopine dehydrogenase NADP-binding domain-containing protein [Simiduia curdlanivorans]
MTGKREFGLVVYGATGYTGRLVCEYLNQRYGVNGDVKWAMAGRSRAKLEQVRDEMGIPKGIPLVVADAGNVESVKSLVAQTQVILTTVGPYQKYGSELVGLCCEVGTDYVDLCGEPAWMHEMIAQYGAAAKASGARIVFSCGFDSVPFDLGVLFLQLAALKKWGKPLARVKGRVRAMKGTFSGGTLESFRLTMKAAAQKPELVKVLTDPFALTERFIGPEQPTGMAPIFEPDLNSWSAPFVMATINTKNIHRSNLLLAHRYGENFVYDEMLLTGPGEKGEMTAKAVAADKSMAKSPMQPGEGPTKEERETGFYDLLFVGRGEEGQVLKACVKGDKDPGYGSTSKMISECAIALLKNPASVPGGLWTPASALGERLIERLEAHAGLTFSLEN